MTAPSLSASMPAMFELTLVRHGDAMGASDPLLGDDGRVLSAAGRAKVRQGAAALFERGASYDLAWSSPLPRAVQTAELLLAGLGAETVLEVYDFLTPGGSAGDVFAALSQLADPSRLLIVSHEPLAGRLAGLLAGRAGGGLHTAEIRHFHLRSTEPGDADPIWRWPASTRL